MLKYGVMDPSYLGQPIPTPTANKPTGLMTKRMLFIVLGIAAALVAAVVLMFVSSDKSGPLQQRLSARQAAAISIINDGQKNLQSDDLQKLNSELKLVLLGDTLKLEAGFKALGMKKVEKEIVAAEADTATLAQLKTAKLNAQYDDTYRTVLTQKLESLRALVQELHGATKSKSLKAILNDEYKHLGIYLTALETQTP